MNTQVILTMKEQHRLKMVVDYEAGKVVAQRAAELLGISKRQFRRLVAAYRQRGIAAMAHGNRGRVPVNHQRQIEVRTVALVNRDRNLHAYFQNTLRGFLTGDQFLITI